MINNNVKISRYPLYIFCASIYPLPFLSIGFVTNLSRPTDREPSDDSSPTETCVCVHCFPDLKALGQGHDSPLRAPFTFYQQAVLQKAQIQKEAALWTEDNLYTSGMEVHEEAAEGWGPFISIHCIMKIISMFFFIKNTVY